MPQDMPERISKYMPDRMPEDMSDRMPEDLPVRKCINVMVGIIRSEVFFQSKELGTMANTKQYCLNHFEHCCHWFLGGG